MYNRILYATDLSENHLYMSEKAMQIAMHFRAKLYLLHVIEPPASMQLAQGLGFAEFDTPVKANAEAVLSVLGQTLGVPEENQFVEVGPIKTHIFERATELDCQMIIIGSHTHHRILGLFTENTAHHVTSHAPCDVLVLQE